MENFDSRRPRERIRVNTESYRSMAHELCVKHADEIYDAKMAFPPLPELGRKLSSLPPGTLDKVWGHGILRGTHEQQVAAALSIIENSAIAGDVAPIARSGHIDAYTHGITFLVVLDPKDSEAYLDKTAAERRDSKIELIDQDGGVRPALYFKPIAIISNSHFDSLVPDLKQMYPSTSILTSDEAYDFFINLQGSSD